MRTGQVAAILIVAVIATSALGFLIGYSFTVSSGDHTKTLSLSASSVTSSQIVTQVSTVTSILTDYSMVQLPPSLPQCASAEQNNNQSTISSAFAFHMMQNSTIFLCVRLFYYNATLATVDPLSIISLDEEVNNSMTRNNAMPNFTVSEFASNNDNVTLGGPNSVGDGT